MRLFAPDPAPPPEPKIVPRIIIIREPLLSEAEIDDALYGNSGALWYKAILQLIDGFMQDSLTYGASGVPAEKPLVMAGGLKVHEVLSELLVILDKKVNATSSEQRL